jgi:uncharacterized protein (TIGR02444 family)
MTAGADPADDPLWTYAVALYARPGVAAACLLLQDRLGADVNLLLAGAWAGAAHGRRLDAAACRRLDDAVRAWHRDVVQPLRAARRALKPAHPGLPDEARLALREDVKTAELEAERLEIAMLSAALALGQPRGTPPAGAAEAAAGNLLGLLPDGTAPDKETCAALAAIIAGALPALRAAEAEGALATAGGMAPGRASG